jgi:hypothetical protein
MLPVESPEQCGACQVLPDAEEERPPYFAGYGNVNFIRFNKRASTFLESRPPGKIIMQWHSLSLLQKSPEALAKFIIERNIAHYKKCLAQTSDERQRQVLQKLLADELAKKSSGRSGSASSLSIAFFKSRGSGSRIIVRLQDLGTKSGQSGREMDSAVSWPFAGCAHRLSTIGAPHWRTIGHA